MTFPFPMGVGLRDKPDPFTFTNVVGAGRNVVVDSATITPVGFDIPVEVSATNGAQISVNGGTFSSLIQLLLPGQTLKVRLTSANAWATAVSTTITAGGRSTTWSVTTASVTTGAWDTGWTAGSWTFTTPAVFNWVRVQLWGPGGGGGGGNGFDLYPWEQNNGSPGGSGGYAQFAGGPYVTGGGYGTGATYAGFTGEEYQPHRFSGGYTTAHGSGYGGDSNVYAGGAGGGAGGWGYTDAAVLGAYGGTGGTGGYLSKTYSWGQIAASTGQSVYIQGPGGGGATSGYVGGGFDRRGGNGATGGYGRCYIDWG